MLSTLRLSVLQQRCCSNPLDASAHTGQMTLDEPVFLGGGSRPNVRFRKLCQLAEIPSKTDPESGAQEPWGLKDL